MTWRGWAVAVLLGSGAVWGEPRTFQFECYPEDAEVYLIRPGTSPELKGRANERLQMECPTGSRLLFRRAGWREQTLAVAEGALPPLRLEPQSDVGGRMQQMFYWLKRYGGLAVMAALILGAVARWLRSRRRQAREAPRAEAIHSLVEKLPERTAMSMRQIGDYRVLELLGRGGMAQVYRAVPNDSLDESQAVAIKIMEASDEVELKRFQREIQICQDLSHPNIVRLIAHGMQGARPYLVMELLLGETLRQRLQREKKLEPRQAVELLLPIMDALDVVHERGVIHRDLKPENIFLTREGIPKIVDFGVARGDRYTVATATDSAMGTPAYMAPEQVEGIVDPQIDQYALGVVLFEMIAGRVLFLHPDPVQQAYMHVDEPPVTLSSLGDPVPPAFDRALLRMLAKSPSQRFPRVKAAGLELLRSLNQ